MKIEKELSKFKKRIDQYLERFLNGKLKEARKISPLSEKIIRSLKDFTLRSGKRLRAALIAYSYLACGGKDRKMIEELSIFIELIHNSLLIQDDIVDRDDLRRGKPTLHREFEEWLGSGKTREREHFGNSLAIFGGNISCALGYEIILKSEIPDLLKIKILKIAEKMFEEVNFGEILDIYLSKAPRVKVADVYKAYLYKSEKYTIEAPVIIGATLAGASKKQAELLRRFALPLGLAFQIKDDFLGIFGEEKVTGKAVGADIKEGKKTILILETLKRLGPSQRVILEKALGNRNLNKKGIKMVRRLIKESGALEAEGKLLNKLTFDAKGALGQGRWQGEGQLFLERIIDFIIERNY